MNCPDIFFIIVEIFALNSMIFAFSQLNAFYINFKDKFSKKIMRKLLSVELFIMIFLVYNIFNILKIITINFKSGFNF